MVSRRPAPVVLFAFNRPEHTARTLEALSANRLARDSSLHIFCDGPKDDSTEDELGRIAQVRSLVRTRRWCGEVNIHERATNFGLAGSIRDGLERILGTHDRAIVLEDDIVTSSGFLRFMNDALTMYGNRDDVMHITGYLPATSYQWTLPETFLASYMSCWGWATWSRAWASARWSPGQLLEELDRHPGGRRRFDLDGTAGFSAQLEANHRGDLRTWAVYWGVSIYLSGGLCLFPGRSLVANIGTDGTGENFQTDQSERYRVRLADRVDVKSLPSGESIRGRAYLRAFHRYGRDSRLGKRLRMALGRGKHRIAQRLRHPKAA